MKFSRQHFEQFRNGIIFSLLILIIACGRPDAELKIIFSDAQYPDEIVPVKDSIVKPVVYNNPVNLQEVGYYERKQAFVDLFLPSILIVRYKLNRQLERVELIALKDSSQLTKNDRELIDSLYRKYKTDNLKGLQEKLTPHPASLALAQAAIESAWGTSRFYTEACNPFGLWSFNKNEPRIRAKVPRPGGHVYLRKFSNTYQSIEGYYYLIATGPYSDFRKSRKNADDVFEMIPHLDRYSELSSFYLNQIKDVIRTNNFTKYDHYQIDPEYIKKRIVIE